MNLTKELLRREHEGQRHPKLNEWQMDAIRKMHNAVTENKDLILHGRRGCGKTYALSVLAVMMDMEVYGASNAAVKNAKSMIPEVKYRKYTENTLRGKRADVILCDDMYHYERLIERDRFSTRIVGFY